MTMGDLHSLYLALRDVMKTAAPSMKVAKDQLGDFMLTVPQDVMASKDPIWFGSVRLTATNVSFYLPPLAAREGRDLPIPEKLKARSTSKTCFTFVAQDDERFAELATLTQKCAEAYAVAAR